MWLLLAIGCNGAAPNFLVPAGDMPVDVAAGDIDRDGVLDLISANGGEGTISVRLQRAGEWVGDPVTAASDTHMVGLGDVDADGDLDLVATGHDSDGVQLWLGDGTGAFGAAPGSPFPALGVAGPHNHGLVVADLDGDGDADVATADQEAEAAAVLMAQGGVLGAGIRINLGAQPYPLAVGDFDGDARPDLVVPLVGGAAVGVVLQAPTGWIAAPGSPFPTERPRPYGLALGDLDGDGRLDVVAIHDDTDRASVWLGDGAGSLTPRGMESLEKRIWRGAIADTDGDGAPDLIGVGSGRLMIAVGDGTGALGPIRRIADAGGWVVIAPDLDADGRVDAVVADMDANALRVFPAVGR